jgi:hypothetical protein
METKMLDNKIYVSTSFVLLAILVGCGGGGGGDNSSATIAPTGNANNNAQNDPAAFPILSAMQNYYSSPQNYVLNGTVTASNGNVANIAWTYTHTPGQDTLFEGVSAKAVQVTISASSGSTPIVTGTATQYFRINPFNYIGESGTSGYVTTTIQGSLPATAKAGDSGPLATATQYADSRKTSVTGRAVQTWSLQADTASSNTAILCFNLNPLPSSISNQSSSDCHRITNSGAVVSHRYAQKIATGDLVVSN